MKYLVTITVYLLIASSALAVADPDPDSIGIWFDLSADTNFIIADVGETVTAYLIISNSTWGLLAGFECTIEFNADNCCVVGDWVYNGNNTMNICEEPAFAVGYAVPLVTEEATWLVSFDLLVVNPAGTMFVVGPAPMPSSPDNLPLCVNGYDLQVLTLLYNSTGYAPDGSINPCAAINADFSYVAIQHTTWSTVKNLWRP